MNLRSAVEQYVLHIRACELFSNASFDIANRNGGFPDFHLQIKLNTSLEKIRKRKYAMVSSPRNSRGR